MCYSVCTCNIRIVNSCCYVSPYSCILGTNFICTYHKTDLKFLQLAKYSTVAVGMSCIDKAQNHAYKHVRLDTNLGIVTYTWVQLKNNCTNHN